MESMGKPESLCRVCGDKASGKHYGVASCDGCRGFFKRSIRRNLDYVCKEQGRCVVDVSRRNQCQACRFSKCLRVNMKKDAVQHERAPRPLAPHQIALQKLGYTFARNETFVPSPAPLTFSAFPSLHTYGGIVPTLADTLPSAHNSFLDRSSFQDFAMSRAPGTTPDVPLIGPQMNALNSLNSFKIPLFSTPLHYPVPHPGYLPTNIFYPPVISTDISTSTVDKQTANKFSSITSLASLEQRSVPEKPEEKPDSLSDKIKEDEVSSSEEVFKTDGTMENKPQEDFRTTYLHSPGNFEPPIHIVSKAAQFEHQDETRARTRECQKQNRSEIDGRSSEETRLFEMKLKKYYEYGRISSEGIYDPAAKLLVASIRWVHGVSVFAQMKAPEQVTLLHSNWKEIFFITAAQYSFYFDEDHVPSALATKRQNIKDELKKITSLLKRISRCRLDKSEYDWIKTALLFRTGSIDSPSHVELLQDQTLASLQEHCAAKDLSRFGRLMLLVATVCSQANQGTIELLLFPCFSTDDINSTLSRILMFSCSL